MCTTVYGLAARTALVCLVLGSPLAAQTRIVAPDNSYAVADDVKLGREASAEVRKELPMLNDQRVDDYVENIGRRLVAAIPDEFRRAEFQYSFDVVDQKEINAFALPGGPMYLNRGMIEAAKTEGEVAGVMAHEISHVALRHGTAQAAKGQKFQIGSVLGQIAGAIIGGTAGSIISQGSQFGLGAYFLKYGREYETQADLLGAQMMARAGYDPREMANMFKTIESEGKSSGPEWLSSHPNPGNRFNAITKEAQALRVQGNANTGQFATVKARLNGMPPAYTAEQIAKGQAKNRTGTGNTSNTGNAGVRTVAVEPPAAAYRTYQPGQFLKVSVPSNWQQFGEQGGVTYAPTGGFFEQNGGTAFTHGVQIGTVTGGSGNLQRDTDQLLQNFAKSNPNLRRSGNYQRDTLGGRQGLTARLSNVSEVSGKPEVITLSTTKLRDNSILFVIAVAPQDEATAYQQTFARVRQSMQLNDR
jgi:Zn-dependent protease with chaperone function